MYYTKIVAHLDASTKVATAEDLRAFLDAHDFPADQLRDLEVHPDNLNGGVVFAAMPTFVTARFILDAIPGVNVFDPHTSPDAIHPADHKLLKAHGTIATDTGWSAHRKLCTSLKLTGTMIDPSA